MNLGVIVGRFQVPELHTGHRLLLEHVLSKHSHVLVLLGCSSAITPRNPLDFVTRERMLRAAYDVLVSPLVDMPSDDAWSQQLDGTVRLVNPFGTTTLYGGRDSFIPHYKGTHKCVEIEMDSHQSGTQLREITAGKIRVSADFRAGVIYSLSNQYQRVLPTVDVAIIQGNSVLVGTKPNSDKLHFPGGFVDTNDSSLEHAACRELREETGLSAEVGAMKYLFSQQVVDWRYTEPGDGAIMTHFFCTHYTYGAVRAGDDLATVQWINLDAHTDYNFSDGHKKLFTRLLQHLRVLNA